MTSIVRRNRYRLVNRDFARLHRPMDRFFDRNVVRRLSGRSWLDGARVTALPIDIAEKDGDIVVRASLPGFAKDEIDVQVHDGVLSITAKRSEQHEESGDDGERYYRRERRIGSVSRRIALPDGVDGAKTEAELRDGVLTLTIPTPEESKPKQIEIEAA
jgi:HSP20 family protein